VSDQPQDPSSVESPGSPLYEGRPAVAATPSDDGPAIRAQGLSRRPEVLIGATFAGGFILAAILKRLAR
jgi:hypothetical protein